MTALDFKGPPDQIYPEVPSDELDKVFKMSFTLFKAAALQQQDILNKLADASAQAIQDTATKKGSMDEAYIICEGTQLSYIHELDNMPKELTSIQDREDLIFANDDTATQLPDRRGRHSAPDS